jgi:hypothetical protein
MESRRTPIKSRSYHHAMMLSRAEDRGGGLHTWKVNGTTSNKQSRAAEKGCSSSIVIASW